MAVCVWRQTFNIRKATILMGVITMVILGSRTGLSWQPCVRIWLAVGGAHWLVLEHIGAARAIKPCIFLRERGTRELRNKGIVDFFFLLLTTYCCFYRHNGIINFYKSIIRNHKSLKGSNTIHFFLCKLCLLYLCAVPSFKIRLCDRLTNNLC